MIKALSAAAIVAFMATALTILPGFAPQVEASTSAAPLAKGDRLDVAECRGQAWPNIEQRCLKGAKTAATAVRYVSADRN